MPPDDLNQADFDLWCEAREAKFLEVDAWLGHPAQEALCGHVYDFIDATFFDVTVDQVRDLALWLEDVLRGSCIAREENGLLAPFKPEDHPEWTSTSP